MIRPAAAWFAYLAGTTIVAPVTTPARPRSLAAEALSQSASPSSPSSFTSELTTAKFASS
jgi:hypothetical protein